jgi:hypothetical protein
MRVGVGAAASKDLRRLLVEPEAVALEELVVPVTLTELLILVGAVVVVVLQAA